MQAHTRTHPLPPSYTAKRTDAEAQRPLGARYHVPTIDGVTPFQTKRQLACPIARDQPEARDGAMERSCRMH